jgi:pimeloyl-ACP methyl ester carboxylesterase
LKHPIVLVHGWSATSASMLDLKRFLQSKDFGVTDVWLGDYISMDDDVRVEDVARRMQRVLRNERDRLGKFDMIVHSTGGLVAREWLTQFYPDGIGKPEDPCPVRRLLMLAPANFGSRLAASGKSFIGRIAKGWDHWFHTGEQMLNELELASYYQWKLACRDLISEDGGQSPYGGGRVLPFVIVGSRGYKEGLQQIANENGSDGTVRPAAANMNVSGFTVDFSAGTNTPNVKVWNPRIGAERLAFAVLSDRDHGTILNPAEATGSSRSDLLGQLITRALSCEDAGYAGLCDAWDQVSAETIALADDPNLLQTAFPNSAPSAQALHQYFQVLVAVQDDDGRPVNDYFLEFFCPQVQGEEDSVLFHQSVLDDVHVNTIDPSRRCLFVDRTDLEHIFYQDGRTCVAVSLSAAPIGTNIRYFESTQEGAKAQLIVHEKGDFARENLPGRLRRNRTHLVSIIIPRRPLDNVFRLSN